MSQIGEWAEDVEIRPNENAENSGQETKEVEQSTGTNVNHKDPDSNNDADPEEK